MGAVGALAFVANLGVAALLYRLARGRQQHALGVICTRNDAIGNLAVLAAAAGVFGSGTGWARLSRRRHHVGPGAGRRRPGRAPGDRGTGGHGKIVIPSVSAGSLLWP